MLVVVSNGQRAKYLTPDLFVQDVMTPPILVSTTASVDRLVIASARKGRKEAFAKVHLLEMDDAIRTTIVFSLTWMVEIVAVQLVLARKVIHVAKVGSIL